MATAGFSVVVAILCPSHPRNGPAICAGHFRREKLVDLVREIPFAKIRYVVSVCGGESANSLMN